ncbi:MAG: tripartite tricarboxylate transporter substrate binding protein [Micromonosporaceae bacterium]|nr:tripartite tricarboxylate transporter substrate binding protein [Micromonosporaceae bacterium]
MLITLAGCGTGDGESGEGSAYPNTNLTITVPSDVGDRFDTTARVLARVLRDSGAAGGHDVDLLNIPGAAGTTALREFVNMSASDPHRLMIMGLSTIGGLAVNESPVGLDQVTPIASLTAEFEAIFVLEESKYRSMGDLMADFTANPAGFKWGGDARGGPDHMLVGLIAQSGGIPFAKTSYLESSGDAATDLVTGTVQAIAGGLSDHKSEVSAGKLRILAVSSDATVPGYSDIPTLKESGVNASLTNWQGLVAPIGISAEDRAAITKMITKMHDSKEWTDALAERGWTDNLRRDQVFASYLVDEQDRVTKLFAGLTQAT